MSSDDNKRRFVKITTRNGRNWKTEINGSIPDIRKYFIGKAFPVGIGDEEATSVVSRVDFLDPTSRNDLRWDKFAKKLYPKKARR